MGVRTATRPGHTTRLTRPGHTTRLTRPGHTTRLRTTTRPGPTTRLTRRSPERMRPTPKKQIRLTPPSNFRTQDEVFTKRNFVLAIMYVTFVLVITTIFPDNSSSSQISHRRVPETGGMRMPSQRGRKFHHPSKFKRDGYFQMGKLEIMRDGILNKNRYYWFKWIAGDTNPHGVLFWGTRCIDANFYYKYSKIGSIKLYKSTEVIAKPGEKEKWVSISNGPDDTIYIRDSKYKNSDSGIKKANKLKKYLDKLKNGELSEPTVDKFVPWNTWHNRNMGIGTYTKENPDLSEYDITESLN